MSQPTNHISALVRGLAQKIAAEGQPDRMTQEDGHGGITTGSDSPTKHPDEEKVKTTMPADGKNKPSKTDGLGKGPDRMTQNDGHGGITTGGGSPTKDLAEEDVKTTMPTDGKAMGVKSAADRIAAIRSAVFGKSAPTTAQAQPAASGAPATKAAAEPQLPSLDFSVETLAKIASAVMSTEEGATAMFRELHRQEGEKAAAERIREVFEAAEVFNKAAAVAEEVEFVKQAATEELLGKAASVYEGLLAAGVTDVEADEILKTASAHQANLDQLPADWIKAAYAQGMDDAAMLDAAAEEGGDEAADGALPMGGEELSEEDIIALIEQAIEAGIITPEDVEAALAEGGGEGAEMGAEMGGGAEMPPA